MAGAYAIIASGLIAAVSTPPAAVALQSDVIVQDPQVELGELMNLSHLPPALSLRAASLPITRFQPGETQMMLSTQRLAERARALMPALGPWLSNTSAGSITVHLAPAKRSREETGIATQARCMRLEHAVSENVVIAEDDVSAAPCPASSPDRPVRYDRLDRVARATRALSAGETISEIPQFALAVVRPGEHLFVEAHIGAVIVSQEVEALQAAGPGRSIFVRTADGQVVAAPGPGVTP